MPGAGALGELALLQMWDGADKLHHVQAALQLAVGVVQQFAVFGGHQVDEFLHVDFVPAQAHQLGQFTWRQSWSNSERKGIR